MNRLLYNRAIVNKLSELIERYPHSRFGQLLVNCDIIELVSDGTTVIAVDPFDEESKITWERMTKNKYCFE